MTRGEFIKKRLTKLGKKAPALAAHCGVTRQAVYSWMANINFIDVKNLKKVCAFLEITSDELIKYE